MKKSLLRRPPPQRKILYKLLINNVHQRGKWVGSEGMNEKRWRVSGFAISNECHTMLIKPMSPAARHGASHGCCVPNSTEHVIGSVQFYVRPQLGEKRGRMQRWELVRLVLRLRMSKLVCTVGCWRECSSLHASDCPARCAEAEGCSIQPCLGDSLGD